MVRGLSCSSACGIFPDQGSNPCPCIGRQILNHCATREAPNLEVLKITLIIIWRMDCERAGLVAGRPVRRLWGRLIKGDGNLK